jgi:hypothetical protein
METQQKSPNRLWRESGTSLSFADWIQREKEKGAFLKNQKFENFSNANGIKTPQEFVQDSIEQAKIELGIDNPPLDPNKKDNTFIGLNKGVLMVSAIIVLGAIGYKIYQNRK